jgi:hypothetical protein
MMPNFIPGNFNNLNALRGFNQFNNGTPALPSQLRNFGGINNGTPALPDTLRSFNGLNNGTPAYRPPIAQPPSYPVSPIPGMPVQHPMQPPIAGPYPVGPIQAPGIPPVQDQMRFPMQGQGMEGMGGLENLWALQNMMRRSPMSY